MLDSGWFFDADYQWEHGSSPVIYKDLVIIQADIQKNSFIAAYNIKDGSLYGKRRAKRSLLGELRRSTRERAEQRSYKWFAGDPRIRSTDGKRNLAFDAEF
jgi:hypothetical protein